MIARVVGDLGRARRDRPGVAARPRGGRGRGQPSGRARSARGSAACRSTTSSTATSSSVRRDRLVCRAFLLGKTRLEKWRFSRSFSYTEAVRRRVTQSAGVLGEYGDSKGEVGLFKVGDKVVYPHHGAGTVVKKEEREVLGQQREYLTIKILHNDMTVNVPCENAEKVGLRQGDRRGDGRAGRRRRSPATARRCRRTGTAASSTTATR